MVEDGNGKGAEAHSLHRRSARLSDAYIRPHIRDMLACFYGPPSSVDNVDLMDKDRIGVVRFWYGSHNRYPHLKQVAFRIAAKPASSAPLHPVKESSVLWVRS